MAVEAGDPERVVESLSLTPIRRFLVAGLPTTALPIEIDGSIFDTTHNYTFGISCFHGHDRAQFGDWTSVSFPFAVSTIYTSSFHVP